MEAVREITGYETSKDYKHLWKLASKQGVICICDFDDRIRDIAHTIFTDSSCCISARGISYVYAFNKDEFALQCERVNLEFLPPTI